MLEALRHEALGCGKCPLSRSRNNVVFGEGAEDARVVFVGEAPGFHEDKQGRPFVGAAGELLDRILADIGFARSEVYIANVLKCRPPENRDPRKLEIDACRPYLTRQLEIIKPEVVCTLGNLATKVVAGVSTGISKLRGRHIDMEGYFVLPMYHPAAALHNPELEPMVREDFENLRAFLERGLKSLPKSEQMGLF